MSASAFEQALAEVRRHSQPYAQSMDRVADLCAAPRPNFAEALCAYGDAEMRARRAAANFAPAAWPGTIGGAA